MGLIISRNYMYRMCSACGSLHMHYLHHQVINIFCYKRETQVCIVCIHQKMASKRSHSDSDTTETFHVKRKIGKKACWNLIRLGQKLSNIESYLDFCRQHKLIPTTVRCPSCSNKLTKLYEIKRKNKKRIDFSVIELRVAVVPTKCNYEREPALRAPIFLIVAASS